MTILADLPAMPAAAAPVLLPGLVHGLGLTAPRVPAWITDVDLIESILAGLVDIPDYLLAEATP
jgi:hypothetical protein